MSNSAQLASEVDPEALSEAASDRVLWVPWERRIRLLAASHVFAVFFLNLLIAHWHSEGVSETMPLLDLLGAGPLPPLHSGIAALIALLITVVGYGAFLKLRNLQPIGCVLATPIWCLSLLLIPHGTFIGLAALWHVWNDRTAFIVSEPYHRLTALAPEVRPTPSPLLNFAVLLSVPLNLLGVASLLMQWLLSG